MRKALPILLLAGLVLGACTGTGPQPEQRTIIVTGTGTTRVTPDIAVVSLGLPPGETTYTVDNTILFTLRAPEKLGAVLQVALRVGSNSVQSVNYSVADPSVPMDEARQLAVADAQRQAEQLAAPAGVSLGTVRSLSEGGRVTPLHYEAPAFGKGGGGGGVPVESGTLEFPAQITLTYILNQAREAHQQ